MPGWLQDFLGIAKSFMQGSACWDFCMEIVYILMGSSPESLAPDAWNYVTGTLYPWCSSIGAVMLNIFCLVGFIKQASNLKENVTTEMWIELFIKVIVGNYLMVHGIGLMSDFIRAAGLMSTEVMNTGLPGMYNSEVDAGAAFAYLIFGLIYILISMFCGVMIVIEVLGRYLNLYILMATAPLALSTIAGGRGIENTAIAWIKSFLTTVFQIFIIAVILKIGGMMIQSNGFSDATGTPLDWFDGFKSVLLSMLYMIFMTTAIKGSDNFLKRTFDLR
ncbi:MAG: hypothetical protein K6F00_02335 [Lachnospiraceae bacterium]|nr:hypothetical protein [Lachnospiraceae bacterium]